MKHLTKIFTCAVAGLLSLSTLSAQKRIVEHRVKDNETVYSIAQTYRTSIEKVFELNPWAKGSIKPGDKLIIYTGADYKKEAPTTASPTTNTATTVKAQPQQDKKGNRHRIEAGETLYRIARNYGVSEEALISANPGISAYNFPVGLVLNIPTKSQEVSKSNNTDTTNVRTEVVKNIDRVKVLLMLPFRKATRYLEFYQGFLMGMNDLKKDGISIHLTALEANEDDDVTNHIFNGTIQGHDLIIGGINDEQASIIAQANHTGLYIVPFSNATNIDNSRLIQLNQDPSEVISRVIPEFINKYRRKTVIFARRDEDADDAFSARLKYALREAQINYQVINISSSSLSLMGKDVVVVPTTADKDLALATMQSLGNNRSCSVFGYPQWQSYGDTFLRQAHQHSTTIYTTFFFDKNTSEAKQFLTKFNAWYNKRVTDSYPKYSVLGYDVARYFIRANAAYGNNFINNGSRLPSDGLQMDIEVLPSKTHQGYTNSRFYFVTFEQDGTTSKQSL